MSSDMALRVQGLSKSYPIYNHPRDRLLQAFWGNRKQFYRRFWALQEISFELARGRTLGVVGRNGSGKSTLLQLICGTLTPTTGSVSVAGRIGALLELGSGFNPEFTGLENVFLNASLLGLNQQETEGKLEEILRFADIGSFIDQPVKTYSSGMAVRLAFAVQAHVQPDLLVVDEALAVGDELFQKKCYAHLEGLKHQGTAILLVTHSCPQILQHCDEALLLHAGRLRLMGAPKLITSSYQRLCNAPAERWDELLTHLSDEPPSRTADQLDAHQTDRASTRDESQSAADLASAGMIDPTLTPASSLSYEAHGIRIERVDVLNASGNPVNLLPLNSPFSLRFHYSVEDNLNDLRLACNLSNHEGIRISGQHHQGPNCRAGDRFSMQFQFHGGLLPGVYFVSGGIWHSDQPGQFLHRVVDICALRIQADAPPSSFGLCDLAAAPPILAYE